MFFYFEIDFGTFWNLILSIKQQSFVSFGLWMFFIDKKRESKIWSSSSLSFVNTDHHHHHHHSHLTQKQVDTQRYVFFPNSVSVKFCCCCTCDSGCGCISGGIGRGKIRFFRSATSFSKLLTLSISLSNSIHPPLLDWQWTFIVGSACWECFRLQV